MKIVKVALFMTMFLVLLVCNIVYAKGAHGGSHGSSHVSSHVSGAKSSSGKTYTGSTTKSYSTNAKGFNSDGTTSTTLIPNWVPFMFLLHGNNYNINGEDKKVDYTLSNIAVKAIKESK